jgi:hypothetical protein
MSHRDTEKVESERPTLASLHFPSSRETRLPFAQALAFSSPARQGRERQAIVQGKVLLLKKSMNNKTMRHRESRKRAACACFVTFPVIPGGKVSLCTGACFPLPRGAGEGTASDRARESLVVERENGMKRQAPAGEGTAVTSAAVFFWLSEAHGFAGWKLPVPDHEQVLWQINWMRLLSKPSSLRGALATWQYRRPAGLPRPRGLRFDGSFI